MIKMVMVPESQKVIVSLTEAKNEANTMLNAERVRHQAALDTEAALFEHNTLEIEYVVRFLDKRIAELEKPKT
jgi:hypothetical protein